MRTYTINHHNFELSEDDQTKIQNIINRFTSFEVSHHIDCKINYYNGIFITKVRLSAPFGRLILSNDRHTDLIKSAENAFEKCFKEFNIFINNKVVRTSHVHGITSSKVVKL